MKKSSIIIFLIFVVVSAFVLIFAQNIYDYCNEKIKKEVPESEFLYGSKEGEHGRISLKLRVDNSGAIKEVSVTEHPDNEIAVQALQKLISSSLDKQKSEEIDAVSGATETTAVYKDIIDSLLNTNKNMNVDDDSSKILLTDTNVAASIERVPINVEGFKSGLGGYIMNTFQDADYNKNGNLVTNEYICAVVLNQYDRIEDVKFDHIVSNISFDRLGKVPTGGAKAYNFASDKSKTGFNGLINDGNYVNIFEFENIVLTYRHFEEIKSRYIQKKGYAPLIYALENAIDNARFIGAGQGDTLGLSVNKVLKKKDIVDSTDEKNGRVEFSSNYCMVTVDKSKVITSCMFDNVKNLVTLTSAGKILGSREKEIYTLNELANTQKYTKIDSDRYALKLQLNMFADLVKGNTIDNLLSIISKCTDDKGSPKPGMGLENLKDIDFIEFIDLISRAYIEAVKIKM